MASWTQEHSMILSLLLDAVVGTKEMVEIRQDLCKILDCLYSTLLQNNVYLTGSKAEGLDLPGSDTDLMFDVNNLYGIKVTQSIDEHNLSLHSTFFMSTANIPPGFALLVQYLPQTSMNLSIYEACQNMNGIRYLSSDLIIKTAVSEFSNLPVHVVQKVKRQGPSAEIWTAMDDKSESGTDNVLSIHCPFLPNESSEWVQRPRHFGWPTLQDISSITNFGFHLVPVGHPHSATKLMEWRISFSMAERTLVWSFNHAQMQCYAVMKIILKEFIKVRCNPQNQILCSYFIKTFLFWKYETTDSNFWREDNLRECIKYLLAEFSKCIREGVLSHYFIPRFNLLFVKLTQAAQTELLQLFEIIIQSDMSILKECTTSQNAWSEFLEFYEKRNIISNKKKQNLLRNDEHMMSKMNQLNVVVLAVNLSSNLTKAISRVLALFCKTPLQTLVLKKCHLEMHLTWLKHTCIEGNESVYQLCRTSEKDMYSYDISTCKLGCAILLFKGGHILSTLNTINQMLSSIKPFAIYNECFLDTDAEQLYVDIVLDSDITMIQRAKKAWMFDFLLTLSMIDVVPLAIQIELYFAGCVFLSPYICAYYLQFLCYHRMHQYDIRDRTLLQLIEVAFNKEQCCHQDNSLNIAGHCLLLTGMRFLAQHVFYRSYMFTLGSPCEQQNSAIWYLLNCF